LVISRVLLCIALVLPATTSSHPPKQEVRAVWITTAAGLDWPRSFDPAEQQAALRGMIDGLRAANFNTIFFQVRARGDAYYHSSYEPWAENLTGVLGKNPGWDPLEFLLREAHQRGMEVHAWFNVYKVRGPATVASSVPLHITLAKSAWVRVAQDELWLDPGIPDVGAYLRRVAMELVRRYNIDGIHFDFIRYPGRNFQDDATYREFGRGMDKDSWRRANIDTFVGSFYDEATAVKPMLKVGSAPLGIYGGEGRLWGSYNGYYQNSQSWLLNGKHDYLIPQLYWDIGHTSDDPDFAQLVRQWRSINTSRHLYAGIAAYKPGVSREIPAQIDSVRRHALHGEGFFRYENIQGFRMLHDSYTTLANIPPMPWKDSIPPPPPEHLAVTEVATNVFLLEWTAPPAAPDGDRARYYNIYRSHTPAIDLDNPSIILAITADARTSYVDTIRTPRGIQYFYAVTAFDKGHNESPPSNTVVGTVRELIALEGKLTYLTSLSTSISHTPGSPILIAYRVPKRSQVLLDLISAAEAQERITHLRKGPHDGGTYIFALEGMTLPSGSYVVRLRTDSTEIEQPLQISSY
jgi:uncharacterized lipoprotein YddW (UPF0748 family)